MQALYFVLAAVHIVAIIGSDDEADACLAASLRASDDAGGAMLTARTYLAWADLCRAKGDTLRADRYTDLALHAAESRGPRGREARSIPRRPLLGL